MVGDRPARRGIFVQKFIPQARSDVPIQCRQSICTILHVARAGSYCNHDRTPKRPPKQRRNRKLVIRNNHHGYYNAELEWIPPPFPPHGRVSEDFPPPQFGPTSGHTCPYARINILRHDVSLMGLIWTSNRGQGGELEATHTCIYTTRIKLYETYICGSHIANSVYIFQRFSSKPNCKAKVDSTKPVWKYM